MKATKLPMVQKAEHDRAFALGKTEAARRVLLHRQVEGQVMASRQERHPKAPPLLGLPLTVAEDQDDPKEVLLPRQERHPMR